MNRIVKIGLCVALAFALGCDDEPERLDGPVSKGDAAEEVSERLCYEWETCDCGELAGVSLTGCSTGMQYSWKARQEDADEQGLTYDGACLTKRLNAMLDRGCEKASLSTVPFCTGETCLIFHGTKKEGEDCDGGQSSSECEQGLVCLGTCVKPCENTGFDLAEGATCRDTELEFYGSCAADLLCDVSDPERGTCLALPDDSEPCLNGQCNTGLWCDFQTQNCAPLVEVGGDCVNPLQCTTGTCGLEQKCTDAPQAGEACVSSCAGDLVCVPSTMGAVCQAIPGKGEACLTNVLERCAAGLTCRDGSCASKPKAGQSCAGDDRIPVTCADGLVCGAKLCSLDSSVPGCEKCAPDDDSCIAQVCTVIPPAVCGDSGGLLY